jgi:hypothetical protein
LLCEGGSFAVPVDGLLEEFLNGGFIDGGLSEGGEADESQQDSPEHKAIVSDGFEAAATEKSLTAADVR